MNRALRQFLGLSLLCAVPIAAQTIRLENGVFRLTATPDTVIGYPMDIGSGTSITFVRRNATTFSVSSGPLEYDDDVGPLLQQFRETDGANWHFRPFELGFDFPFFDLTLRQVFVSAHGAIVTTPPPAPKQIWHQYGPLDVYGGQKPMIAPLLRASGGQLPTFLHLRERSDRLIFTFRSGPAFIGTYDYQVVLKNDGTIVFSYKTLDRIDWGVIAVTSGREAWRTTRTTITSSTDPEDDVVGAVATGARNMIDIVGYDFSRIADSDLIELRFRLKQTPALPAITPMFFLLDLTLSTDSKVTLGVVLAGSTFVYTAGNLLEDSVELHPESQTVTLAFLQSALHGAQGSIPITLTTFADDATDSVSGTLILDAPRGQLTTDLSAVTASVELSKPIIEVFNRPIVSPTGIAGAMASAYGLSGRDVDQYAVYQNFRNANTFFSAGSSSGGNAATAGINVFQTANDEFSPSVIDLNVPLQSPNDTLQGALFLLAHEFGHRWLDSTYIEEEGQNTRVLNPDNAHAGAYVHNPSAFPDRSPFGISVMGGGWFSDLGNGSFAVPIYEKDGYSWWELYLMGLAAPEEVPPWFYVANAQPPLDTGLAPGQGQTYTGTRRNVRIEQIINALGPRDPSFAESQRTFRTLFVMVELPGAPATNDQMAAVATYATEFKRRFAAVTGKRGRIATGLPERPAADFTAASSGTVVTFTDMSLGDPSYWLWSFGDGTTSTLPNPTHRYPRAGTYEVAMTVRNTRGTSSRTMTITVANSPERRRIARR